MIKIKFLVLEDFDLLFSRCQVGRYEWERKEDFFRYNEHGVVSAEPGVMVCKISDTKIYGWAHDDASPCLANENFVFRRILQS